MVSGARSEQTCAETQSQCCLRSSWGHTRGNGAASEYELRSMPASANGRVRSDGAHSSCAQFRLATTSAHGARELSHQRP